MITGPWHAILLQECHGILDELREVGLFHVVHTGGSSDMAIAARKSTFTLVEPFHYDAASSHSWGCVLTVAKCTLAGPWPSTNYPDDGRHHITFGTMHLHNISAKKPAVGPELLRRVDDAMRTHHVDILHGDFNMASSLGYVSKIFDDLVYIHPNDQDILWGMPKQIDADTPGDCCGFVLRRTHWMVDALVSKHGTWKFDYAEVLGISPGDTNSHWMNFIHFQTSAFDRSGLRATQGKQHRAERAKTKGLRKQERKRAALTETKATASTSSKARSTA